MSKLAANPAALSHLRQGKVFAANRGPKSCNDSDEKPSFWGVPSRSNDAAVVAYFRSQRADENSVPVYVFRFVSRLLHGHCFGAYPAPCGSSLFCFDFTTPPRKERASGTPDYVALRVTVSVPDPP